jgi:hypothetical protein
MTQKSKLKGWKAMYLRIKPPKKLNTNVPSSIKVGGVKVVRGGSGIEVRDNALIGKIKKIGGGHIETSKTPFEVKPPKGGVIDLDAMEMKTKDEVEGKK